MQLKLGLGVNDSNSYLVRVFIQLLENWIIIGIMLLILISGIGGLYSIIVSISVLVSVFFKAFYWHIYRLDSLEVFGVDIYIKYRKFDTEFEVQLPSKNIKIELKKTMVREGRFKLIVACNNELIIRQYACGNFSNEKLETLWIKVRNAQREL